MIFFVDRASPKEEMIKLWKVSEAYSAYKQSPPPPSCGQPSIACNPSWYISAKYDNQFLVHNISLMFDLTNIAYLK